MPVSLGGTPPVVTGAAPTPLDGPWWSTGTLDPARHYRLIQQRHAVAQRAGLGAAFMSAIWEPLPGSVSRSMRQWLVNVIYRQPGQHLLVKGGVVAVSEVFRALVGALLRNEFDARLFTVEEIMALLMDGEHVEAGVLFISDFALASEPRTDAVKRKIMGVVRQRINAGLPTVLYASDLKPLEAIYGGVAFEEITGYFGKETLGS